MLAADKAAMHHSQAVPHVCFKLWFAKAATAVQAGVMLPPAVLSFPKVSVASRDLD